MIDILNLASSPPHTKSIDCSFVSKQQHFNDIFSRLRERNTNNEMFIKRYIKKNRKKYGMFVFSNALPNQFAHNPQSNEVKQLNHTISAFQPTHSPPKQSMLSIKEEDGQRNQLKETNISEAESTPLDHNKTIPTLRIRQHTHKSHKKLTEANPQINLEHNKCEKEFTRYLRSFFLNKIVEKSRLKEKQRELEVKANARSLYKGRVKTETEKLVCCKVKVKSLIFGNLQEKEGELKRYQQNVRVHTQSYDNRYYDAQRHQKKQSKSILPSINNNISIKNRKCLENYLRFHQQKANKQKSQCFKITKIPVESELTSATQTMNRKTILCKLNTLQLRKG